jgi:two-component system response regulator
MTLLDGGHATAHRIRPASRADTTRLAAALARAFHDDQVFRHFSPAEHRRRRMLPGFFAVFVDAYLSHGEPYRDDCSWGAALWAHPGHDPLAADAAYGERLADLAGVDAPRLFEIVEALEAHAPDATIASVGDGVDAMRYLRRQDELERSPRPDLVLLDLNMPRMDGRQVLAAVKADEELRKIPIVVLTTSKAEEDIVRTYDLGVNSFITKPVTFLGLVEVMKVFSRYWLEIVDLPPDDPGSP